MPPPRPLPRPHARLKALSGFSFWTLGQAEQLADLVVPIDITTLDGPRNQFIDAVHPEEITS